MMGDPLRPLPLLVKLARETVRVIRQNIVWFGFGVNLVGVAVTGFLWPLFAPSADWYEKAPLIGVLYHQLGSLAVLLNSMRLLAFDRAATNRTLAGVRDRYRAFDRWLATVHPDDALHELAHRWKPLAAAAAVIAGFGWLLSGLTQVNANEVAVVQRFGAVRADLPPGLHVRWPWPVEAVTKLRPDEVRTVELGFRLLGPETRALLESARAEQQKLRRPGLPGVSDRDQTWASAHAEEVARVTDESQMITGDGNLVEVLATVRYTVADPRAFLFGSRDPDAVIRSAAEAVIRELAAGQPFLDLLTANRVAFERRVLDRLDRRLAAVSGSGLGVRLEGLTLHDLHPPQEVVASYHAVAEAIQKRDRLVNEAEADATRTKRRAEEEALYAVRRAEADAARKLAEATAGRDAFLAWHRARTHLSPGEEAALADEIESRVRAGQDRAAVTAEVNAKREQRLAARRALTEFRLGLQSVVGVLAGRDKILLDAADLPGKRHLLLFDPDGLKLPPWMMRPLGQEKEP
jgi:Cu+-exporting ATPase